MNGECRNDGDGDGDGNVPTSFVAVDSYENLMKTMQRHLLVSQVQDANTPDVEFGLCRSHVQGKFMKTQYYETSKSCICTTVYRERTFLKHT